MKLILRADANETIATGHVYRLLALAELLKPQFEIWFCTQSNNTQLLENIRSQVDKLIQLPHQFEYCLPADKELDAEIPFDLEEIVNTNDIVVLDGYWFREKYQLAIKQRGAKLVMIDDFANQYFYADAVINHAPGIKVSRYKGEPHTQYFLGLNYALIRKAFFGPKSNDIKPVDKTVFISFGGSDPYELSVRYTKAILEQTTFKVHLLTSKLFKEDSITALNKLASAYPNKLSIHGNVNALDLKNILDTCTNAIVPASTILFECVARGLKCISGYYTANQNMIYSGFLNEQIIIGIDDMIGFNTNELSTKIALSDELNISNLKFGSTQNLVTIFKTLC